MTFDELPLFSTFRLPGGGPILKLPVLTIGNVRKNALSRGGTYIFLRHDEIVHPTPPEIIVKNGVVIESCNNEFAPTIIVDDLDQGQRGPLP